MDKDYLPEDRLATTDETGKRIYVHNEKVSGSWTNLRKKIYSLLIGIYLVLPWIYINGKQIILLNLPRREFYFFGKTFYGHDGPLLVFVMLGFIFFISFITSYYGRVWCGYACPQTVFIDTLFKWAERLVEGSKRAQEKLEVAPWSFQKLLKRSTKWVLFTIISLHIVHSGLGYFVGTHRLIGITLSNPLENLTLFMTMLTLTGIVLFDFGWFREQFCIIACPYGRFQSIVMDENSLIVAYDKKRGEPRKRTPGVAASDIGDCVNCNKCVHVCPTGIDIRDGLQMECIACTMCIDACDDIMDRVRKPKGLIRYTSEVELEGNKRKFGIRPLLYFLLFCITLIGLISSISLSGKIHFQLLRGSNQAFQLIKTKQKIRVVNHFTLKVERNNSDMAKLSMDKNKYKDIEVITPDEELVLEDIHNSFNIFFKFDKGVIKGAETREYRLLDSNGELVDTLKVELLGPN